MGVLVRGTAKLFLLELDRTVILFNASNHPTTSKARELSRAAVWRSGGANCYAPNSNEVFLYCLVLRICIISNAGSLHSASYKDISNAWFKI